MQEKELWVKEERQAAVGYGLLKKTVTEKKSAEVT